VIYYQRGFGLSIFFFFSRFLYLTRHCPFLIIRLYLNQ